ncbi:MAG: Chromosomal replication initiator protein DnaA [Phycisphaerae bacterium]|nr:Chromosomal replication initiator protein DnaA [Phycisphaerae bacterium]
MILRAEDAVNTLGVTLAERIGAPRYNLWFKNVTRFEFLGDILRVWVANPFIGDWIERHFTEDLVEITRGLAGAPMRLSFSVDPALSGAAAKRQSDRQAEYVARHPEREARSSRPADVVGRVCPLPGTLEKFVVGPSNRLAFSAVESVVACPAGLYNPLFLHGGCGLGKTHLLQAVCNGVAKQHPNLAWRFVTGEEFTNEYIYAVRHQQLDAFRHRYRSVDVLAIDDAHFFANKRSTQEEFLHTFNAIFSAGRQVVLSSDAHPKMIGHLSEHLVNRLVSGMIVRIDSPDLQVRLGVLRTTAQKLGVEVPEPILNHIAETFRANIRELEGALLKVVALAQLTAQPLTLSLAQRGIQELVRHTAPAIRLSDIETGTALFFGLTPADLHTSRKAHTIALARSVAMYLARKHTTLSYPEIGRFMGKKNHSTVILAARRVSQMLQRDETVAWTTSAGQRQMNLAVLLQELEDQLGHPGSPAGAASDGPPPSRAVG